jgi:hypothetical protein
MRQGKHVRRHVADTDRRAGNDRDGESADRLSWRELADAINQNFVAEVNDSIAVVRRGESGQSHPARSKRARWSWFCP